VINIDQRVLEPEDHGGAITAGPASIANCVASRAANETVDGLDATIEALRRAAEDTPSGAAPEGVENVPVFDRAGLAPKI
jgi:hypothetical protein